MQRKQKMNQPFISLMDVGMKNISINFCMLLAVVGQAWLYKNLE